MDADRDSHKHMLGTLNSLAIALEQVTSFQCFEAKEVVVEVSTVIKSGIDLVSILADCLVHIFGEESSWPAYFVLVVVKDVLYF